jgi:hypothetical protein
MNGKPITIVLILILALIFGLIYFSYNKQSDNNGNVTEINFRKSGHIFINNPGFKPGVWYLTYEEPGQPALSKELKITGRNLDIQTGQTVYVEGYESSGEVEVNKLNILNANKPNVIWVDTPLPNQTVINPITVNGYAKSSWYFEATFPIKVLDANGKVLGQAIGQAQSDWTSGGYIEFVASLKYSTPATSTGTLVLEKDNPSGLTQNADELRIPVKFGVEGRAVKLYYYDPNKDKDASGNILASRKGLVAVDRQIPISNTPIQDTIRLLLQGDLSEAERAQGITTEYPLPGVELKSASLNGTILTLEFADPQNKTGGGSARVGVLWFQIEATAKQFPGVLEVKFKPEELFQP